ncbi:HIT family protein [Labedella gwakjiensis]|uniref:HIT family protein n=2 Tax=Labedella gwakjiensis TaxID=390269 RepID=A0ABY0CCA5_9MICO|nr:HIT family protein [Labedella gwakjiensis]RUQ87159.1 HIT family protein [Labedella gwakjiensis]
MSADGRRPLAVHEPAGYPCPFCALLRGEPMTAPRLEDVVAERERAVAFISPRWWARNTGHVLVVPRTHIENLYDVSSSDLHGVMDLVQEVARAMRATYGCSGVSTRQHNEPDGGQDVWHLHVHVFPRYPDDRLYETEPLDGFVSVEERAPFVQRLRSALDGAGEAHGSARGPLRPPVTAAE